MQNQPKKKRINQLSHLISVPCLHHINMTLANGIPYFHLACNATQVRFIFIFVYTIFGIGMVYLHATTTSIFSLNIVPASFRAMPVEWREEKKSISYHFHSFRTIEPMMFSIYSTL